MIIRNLKMKLHQILETQLWYLPLKKEGWPARKKKALDTELGYYRVAIGSENPFKANEDIKIICYLKKHGRRKWLVHLWACQSSTSTFVAYKNLISMLKMCLSYFQKQIGWLYIKTGQRTAREELLRYLNPINCSEPRILDCILYQVCINEKLDLFHT